MSRRHPIGCRCLVEKCCHIMPEPMRQCCSLFFFWPTTWIMHLLAMVRVTCCFSCRCVTNRERRIGLKTNGTCNPDDDIEKEIEEVPEEWHQFNFRFPALYNRISKEIVVGVAPITFGIVNELYKNENVRGVVNLCREWKGANSYYEKLGISHLILPTTDFSLPNEESCRKGADFIHKHAQRGESVYVHCKAGRGRSVAIVVAYLVLYRGMTTRQATDHIIRIRAVAVDNAEKLKYLESEQEPATPSFVTTDITSEETAGKEKQ
jgi:hypothetical protein